MKAAQITQYNKNIYISVNDAPIPKMFVRKFGTGQLEKDCPVVQ